MTSASTSIRATLAAGLLLITTAAETQTHGRKYTPPPATAHIVVSVQKGFNGKPLTNAAVIFHAVKDGKDTGNMEVKTDSRGNAVMDFIEAGSHVSVQVFSDGFATFSNEFDVTDAEKDLVVKLERPRAQISNYQDSTGKSADTQPGVQEHVVPPPASAPPHPSTPQ